MRYYKLLTKFGYSKDDSVIGKIYPETAKIDLIYNADAKDLSNYYPNDWQEVTPAEYYVQEGKLPENYIVECNNAEESSVVLNSNTKDTKSWSFWKYCYTRPLDDTGFGVTKLLSYCPENYMMFSFDQWDQIVNKNKMKEEVMNEIIGWKLKEDCKQYEDAALTILEVNRFNPIFENCDLSVEWSIEKIKQAGVLELWFEPVYKGKTLKFGGYDVTFEKVTSGVRITCNVETGTFSQIEAIYNYFKPNSTYFKFGSQEVKRVEYSSGAAWNLEYEKEAAKSIKIGCTTGTWEEFVAIYEKAKSML